MGNQVAGINIADYPAKKASGTLTIAKVGDAYAIAVKNYSSETGSEIKPQVYGLAIEDLKNQKAELLKSADDIQALITDFEALDVK